MYEYLRAQVLRGGRRHTGFSAVLYHGMARGLALLATTPTPYRYKPQVTVRNLPAMEDNLARVRILANMILHITSELQHVY